MKYLLPFLLLLRACDYAPAATVEWDPFPAPVFILYTGIISGVYDASYETATNECNVGGAISDGLEHYLTVSAVNTDGEIGRSEEIVYRVVQAKFQTSTNLVNWVTLYTTNRTSEPARFFRVLME